MCKKALNAKIEEIVNEFCKEYDEINRNKAKKSQIAMLNKNENTKNEYGFTDIHGRSTL